MKKGLAVLLFILLAMACAACGHASDSDSGGKEREDQQSVGALLPGVAEQGEQKADGSPDLSGADNAKKSSLYDPSIFVIEASGSWRQELAPGYFADYECELYVDKFDANDNRSASGLYTGVFWMKTSIDAAEHLEGLLKDVPVEMDFAAGGEGVCDNLTLHLLDGYERDPFGDYAIPDGQDGGIEPEKEALAGEGGFIAVGTQAYLDARAQGAAGESLTHQDSQTGDAEIRYVIQIEPDPGRTATERKAVIHLSGAGGMNVTIEGTWRRLPGYREDMLEYAGEGKSAEMLEKHLK